MKRLLLASLLGLLCAEARTATGLVELPGTEGDGPVTVFYPTSAKAEKVQRGPFSLQLAPKAAPDKGNGRLVIISHGSGGSPWTYGDLAQVLVADGFIVAAPEHRGDNYKDRGGVGPTSWKRRPAEVSRAIDAVLRDKRFAPLVAADKVGVYGMSAGGHTALSLAGGRWSPAGMARHCEMNIRADFPACAGLSTQLKGDWGDSTRIWSTLWVVKWRFTDKNWQTHEDPRVRAIIAGVPYAADFDMTSLEKPGVPLGIVRAGGDKWLAPRFHSDAVLAVCKPCEKVGDLPTGGHGALLSPLPPGLSGAEGEMLNDPPGFDRAALLPPVDRAIAAFFRRHLLP